MGISKKDNKLVKETGFQAKKNWFHIVHTTPIGPANILNPWGRQKSINQNDHKHFSQHKHSYNFVNTFWQSIPRPHSPKLPTVIQAKYKHSKVHASSIKQTIKYTLVPSNQQFLVPYLHNTIAI